ncbi:Inner membrane protein YhaH [Corynebacterium heidelbergense]|nr:Inner membrane protein YhaH [Corynebacterium heidelbergense]
MAAHPYVEPKVKHLPSRPLYGATIRQAAYRFFAKSFDFRGSASRSEFWIVTGLFWAISFPVAWIDNQFGLRLAQGLSILTAIPWLSLTCRRLHDAGFSIALLLIAVVPFLGWIILSLLIMLPPCTRDGHLPKADEANASAKPGN